ncbi:long-chain fatty acid--CoA ligase [Alicyclobacillaceae bacterium I2511]|nr:long-chain fatty acid--CoA ligase [Alicyclobacillaceae bacterium I2511]
MMEPEWLKFWPAGVPRTWEKPQTTLATQVQQWAQMQPNKTAVLYYGQTLSYAELADWMGRTAAALKSEGIQAGDRVLLFMQNIPQFLMSYLAVHALGAVVVAANPMFLADELLYELQDSGAKLIVAGDELAPVVEQAVPQVSSIPVIYAQFNEFLPNNPFPRIHPDMLKVSPIPPGRPVFRAWAASHDPLPPVSLDGNTELALLQYTSGTTGQPKGAMILHRNLLANVVGSALWAQAGPNSVHMGVLPFFHVAGMVHSFLAPLYTAGTILLFTRFEVEPFIQAMDRYRATHWVGISTMNIAVTNFPDIQKYQLDSLQACLSGGAPIPVQILEAFRNLTGVTIIEGYGLSETISQVTINPPDHPKLGSVGIPVFDVDVRITKIGNFEQALAAGEQGEIWVKGPQVMAGYWQRPDETALVLRPDGWLDTGDIGYLDQDGYLFIVGRSKELIKASGYSVFPAEVESFFYKHPAVAEAAVIGVPDTYRGESLKAFIVLRPGENISSQEMVAWAHSQMAAYKAPQAVEIREFLPKNSSGKILRRVLMEEQHSKDRQD